MCGLFGLFSNFVSGILCFCDARISHDGFVAYIQWGATILRQCLDMVPALQIDIYVTKFTPSSKVYNTTSGFSHDEHSSAQHGGRSRRNSQDAIDAARRDIDLGFYTGEHDEIRYAPDEREAVDFHAEHEIHISNLTKFDGDVDASLLGEDAMNRRVKKEGALRRARTRKATMDSFAAHHERHDDHHPLPSARNRDGRPRNHAPMPSNETYLSTDGLLSTTASVLTEHQSGDVDRGRLTVPTDPSQRGSGSRSPSVLSHASHALSDVSNWDVASTREMIEGAAGGQVRLEIEEHEMQDINIMAEHARPGRPDVGVIMKDEAERSQGSMIVACEFCVLPYIILFFKCKPQVAALPRYAHW